MDNEIIEEYEKIRDKISEEEFLEKMKEKKKDYEDISFMSDLDIARTVVGEYITEKNEHRSENEEHLMDKISKLESGAQNLSVIGRIMGISNPKVFTSRKGKVGKLANLKIADDTGEIRAVLWTENIKLLKQINEGDVVQINKVDVKDGYRPGTKEIHLTPRSTIDVLDSEDYLDLPEYEEPITLISDIEPDTEVNIIARLIRLPKIRTYEKNGKEGQVASLELQDETGKISYTLWNKDTDLINSLELNEGDSLKILSASARERNGEISLSHWDGRIIKGDFEVPEYEDKVLKIAEVQEMKDVSLIGLVTKIQDTIEFDRADGSKGAVKSIEIADDTGSIRVTLWGDDTNLEINKGDIIKITGGNIEFDEYTETGYRVNTNWNTQIITDPDEENNLIDVLKEYQAQLGPIKVEQVQLIEEDGEEVDVLGRIINMNDPREFQRDDGTTGLVRSGDLADETGMIRLSFWDEKAQNNFEPGKAFLIENARTRMGLYAVELNIGKTARVIELAEEDTGDLPSFTELEDMIYTLKKIEDLEEDDVNVKVIARIVDIQEPNEFQRQDGTPGLLRNMEIGDDTGIIRTTLWNEQAEIQYEVGDALKIENPRVSFRNDQLELSISNSTKITKANEDDLKDLPSFEELEEILYVSKNIADLEDDDKNVKIQGNLGDTFGNNILSARCPNCNNRLEQLDDEYVCDYCGEDVEKPRYLLMIPARIEDDTGDISITFFGKLAEKLLDMTTDEAAEIVEDSADEGVLEGKVENLAGLGIKIIADVNFDEYNEEIRLNPKKIISTEL
ncbi:replication protein A [Methanobrevibacter sp. TMH8]|uniref:OB-fold nucleic acid binding domain-containing protein n=1 Tax=Methanobrevibacter sp. TMH8 TaxID=2848611 RepID=UPI001CCE8FBF|nr:OB-fold nucleic acid binding domain-containing protein [Methanobrevibacter sp. TMH8]MBZ9570419.1 replication protein A [Methanobrevibacter sp. TMH8]